MKLTIFVIPSLCTDSASCIGQTADPRNDIKGDSSGLHMYAYRHSWLQRSYLMALVANVMASQIQMSSMSEALEGLAG